MALISIIQAFRSKKIWRLGKAVCGRYSIDNEMREEIERLSRCFFFRTAVNESENEVPSPVWPARKDIHPSEEAPVLLSENGAVSLKWQRFGFPGISEGQLIFNARCESVMEKQTFRESIRCNRCVVPASWFYEWNRKKEKSVFRREDQPVLFMAGCCRRYEDGGHFVILTTAANPSMQPVHDRMPLILEREQIVPWILDERRTEGFLKKTPPPLRRETEYEQLSLF